MRPRQESIKYANISHRDATHTYTRTYIHAHRCMHMIRYVAYLLHPFVVFFIHIYDSLQGAGNGETPARVFKICEYILSLLRSLIYIYINMTLYRELGTVRPQQESIKNINTSHPHANVLKLCSLLSRYVAYLLHPFIVFFIYIYDSLQGAGNGESPARVYKICEYIPSLLRSLVYMTLYRELGTVRPQQESINLPIKARPHLVGIEFFSLLTEERTRRVARDLLETHSHLFEHLQRLQQNNDNQHDHGVVGRVPPAVRSCELCGRAKHRVRWVYSTSGKGKRKPSGSSCFACWKTCVRLLRCSRSPRLLRESGAIGVVKDLSLKVQRDLGSEDVCTCASCRPTK